MEGLHGNIITRKCIGRIDYKDGTAQIIEMKLEGDVKFSLSEMRKWQIEQSKKPIKSIKFIEATNEGLQS